MGNHRHAAWDRQRRAGSHAGGSRLSQGKGRRGRGCAAGSPEVGQKVKSWKRKREEKAG